MGIHGRSGHSPDAHSHLWKIRGFGGKSVEDRRAMRIFAPSIAVRRRWKAGILWPRAHELVGFTWLRAEKWRKENFGAHVRHPLRELTMTATDPRLSPLSSYSY